MAERRVHPFEFVRGGLLNDADVEVIDSRFVRWDYGEYGADDDAFTGNGKGPEITAFTFAFQLSDGSKARQFWSVGGEDDFVPSKDGTYLVATGEKASLNMTSNYALLMASIENCLGERPPEDVAEDVSKFVGLEGHVLRVPQPKRQGLKNTRRRDDGSEEREPEVLTFDNIKSAPWEKGKGKGKGAKKTQKAASKQETAPDNGEVSDQAAELIKKVLVKAGGELDLDELGLEVYKLTSKDVDKVQRKAIMGLVNDPKFVAGIDDVEVEGGKASMA